MKKMMNKLIYIKEKSGAGNIKLTHANASVASPLYQDSNLRDLITTDR